MANVTNGRTDKRTNGTTKIYMREHKNNFRRIKMKLLKNLLESRRGASNTLYQETNFYRLVQIESICRRQNKSTKNDDSCL